MLYEVDESLCPWSVELKQEAAMRENSFARVKGTWKFHEIQMQVWRLLPRELDSSTLQL